ncbi:hypothetical protein AB4037_16265 [Labrys sp. KB_33_2]|uniref:hypothetical protein n=1 Tax=Labrys sp. KB_33_2 TaxID=3237479 RepID=UPI003F8F9614
MPGTLARRASERQRWHFRAGFALILVLLLAPTDGRAVLPASPQLERESRNALMKALGEAGISETGSSAVLSTLLSVLGTEPAARQYRYSEPYPQLPDVTATAVPAEADCARAELTVLPKTEPRRPVTLHGLYCLVDRASYTWRGRSLQVEPR